MSKPLKIARAAILAAGLAAIHAAAASAQEYCVVCTAPQAMYRCAIDNYRPGSAHNLPAVCTDAMSRIGSHGGCTVGKGITVLDCKGPLKRVDIANPASPIVTDAAEEDAKAAKAKSESGEPKTVLDMLKRVQPSAPATPPPQPSPATPPVKRSDQIAPAPAPVARPASEKSNPLADTWRCMSSFFTKCGD